MLRAFAIYIAIAVMVAALAVVLLVRNNVEVNSQEKVEEHAAFVASTVIPQLIGSDEWDKPLTGARLEQIDAAVKRELLTNGSLRVKLYSPDGQVIYSSEPGQIGDQGESDEIKEVLGGETTSEISHLNDEGGRGKNHKVIEAYTAVSYPDNPAPVGVFEYYNDYQDAAGSIRDQALPLTIAVIVVMLLLYLALLPLLKQVTRQLNETNDELRRRADDLKENLVERAAIEDRLRETIARLEDSEEALTNSQEETIMRLSLAVESRDQETGSHIERMGRYCMLMAEKLGWDEKQRELLRIASPLHDVGKIAIPDAVLQKPGALTPDEREIMERHAEIGHQILAGSTSPLLDLAAKIALSHHEHWDGGGYPNGLIGEEIPIEGRIAAIADVFDALTSDRVYRKAMPVERALSIMSEGRGSHFDPELLDVFFNSMAEVLQIRDGRSPEDSQTASTVRHESRRRRMSGSVASNLRGNDEDEERRQTMVG